ncbi:protein-lysine 6-oxidase [Streptomyces sp. GMY02]|uniref:lysyl oxidase family protein n=1 Tax=Streptomyces sp. GMY02 TaxID=1333528 RepID=UPI001C2C954B|nr:lysyl oxidase family protein [Streptomyces sp. GMY02]QXE37165.1 protein-lysine 6-oxidase [Streptomyces sp. GMY02]
MRRHLQQHGRGRTRRSVMAAAAALSVVAGVAGAAPVAGAATPAGPRLSLIAASGSVTIDRWEGEPGVYLDLGTYVTADGAPLEFRVTRTSYKDPVVAEQIIREGKKTKVRALPEGLVKDFGGLPDFLRVTLTDTAGTKVLDRTETFCPNNASGRVRPDAPATSKYPESCPTNPFTLGSVWGIENGWATNTNLGYYAEPVDVPAGEYTARVEVTKPYRDLFGMPEEQRTLKLTVRERSWDESGGGRGIAGTGTAGATGSAGAGGTAGAAGAAATRTDHGAHSAHSTHSAHSGAALPGFMVNAKGHAYHEGRGADAPAPPAHPHALAAGPAGPAGPDAAGRAVAPGDGPGRTDGSRIAPALAANAKRPTGRASVPDVPKPDLRALPAWDISVTDGEDGDIPGKDYLAFSANVWNAGPAPLVVDGFRTPGKDLMDAYQYFYDAKGTQVGYSPAGTMEWDARVGHEHWHFTDFASYRLLRADQKEIVRSEKEAFCLANTDAIDYTVKNANWHPNNTDLSTACGTESAISVREVLDVGSGDTYTQYRPGQSFDITDLPNGTYYIEVIANPENRLYETSLTNNVALREVVLSGTPGAREVTVPPHDLIDAP